MKRFLHIVLVLLATVACQRTRIIPRDTLEDIYMDMFLADQVVREENIPHAQMDTTLLYEAVFRKYGYDTDDYLNSVRHYLKDPERFAKVFESVAKRLEGEIDALDKIVQHQEWVARRLGAKRPGRFRGGPRREGFLAGGSPGRSIRYAGEIAAEAGKAVCGRARKTGAGSPAQVPGGGKTCDRGRRC